jgi:hypothetical protein
MSFFEISRRAALKSSLAATTLAALPGMLKGEEMPARKHRIRLFPPPDFCMRGNNVWSSVSLQTKDELAVWPAQTHSALVGVLLSDPRGISVCDRSRSEEPCKGLRNSIETDYVPVVRPRHASFRIDVPVVHFYCEGV